MDRSLTPKQARFALEYIVDLNATQAAIRSGYSARTANEQACRLLANVNIQAAIQGALQKRSARTDITADRVLQELAKVAFADVRGIFDSQGALIRIVDLTDEAAACVAGCELVTVQLGEGEVEYVAKLKLADKLKALELVGRHLGMFNDKLALLADVHVLNVHRKPKAE